MRSLKIAIAAALAATMPAAAAPPKPQDLTAQERKVKAAEVALQLLDEDLLFADAEYARGMLAHVDMLRAARSGNAPAILALDSLRVVVLGALGRYAEAAALGTELISRDPEVVQVYPMTLLAAAATGDTPKGLAALEAAARHVTEQEELALLRPALPEQVVTTFWQSFLAAKDEAGKHRLAEALVTLGWPEPDRAARLDQYRVVAVDGRLAKGDIEGARRLAGEVTQPRELLTLLAARRYDALWPENLDRIGRLKDGIAAYDAATARRVERKKDDLWALLERAQFLRAVDREEEAAALLLPHATKMDLIKAKTDAGSDEALWLVNEAAYTLVALRRPAEGVALMEKIGAFGLENYPDLISMTINHGGILNEIGRHREAAAHAERLVREKAPASPYGDMWIWETAACAHGLSGNPAAAAPWMRKIEAASDDNPAAHMRALLCLDRLDEAERLLVKRLQSAEAPEVLVNIQDYRLGLDRPAGQQVLRQRFRAVRDRPSVAAAVEKAGRILPVPLSITYWGGF